MLRKVFVFRVGFSNCVCLCAGDRITKMSGKDFAKSLIASKKVVVISKSYCPFCVAAKVSVIQSTLLNCHCAFTHSH